MEKVTGLPWDSFVAEESESLGGNFLAEVPELPGVILCQLCAQ